MAVYYLKEYIEYTKKKVDEAKMKWVNGENWDEKEYERLKFLEDSLKYLIEMRKHGEIFYTDF